MAAGLNSLGILLGGGVGQVMAHWIADGEPPVDVTGYAIDRTAPHESTRKFRQVRTAEQSGVLFGDAVYPRGVRPRPGTSAGVSCTTGWRPGRPFQRLGRMGVRRVVREPGRPRPTVSGFGRPASFPLVAEEHRTVRGGRRDLRHDTDGQVPRAGTGRGRRPVRLSANHVAREPGRVVYTQWLTPGGGIAADLTVTRLDEERFLVVASDIIQRRVEPMIRRATGPGEHCVVTDVTSGTVLLSVQGPRSRELLSRLSSADLSNQAFPYLTAQTIDVGYARALALRITYVGELGYELHIPAEYAARSLRLADRGRCRPRGAAGRPVGHDQSPAGEGLPRSGRGYRQHRQPAPGRARVRGGLRQARRVHRPPGAAGVQGPSPVRLVAGERPGQGPRDDAVRQRARPGRRNLDRLRAGGRPTATPWAGRSAWPWSSTRAE